MNTKSRKDNGRRSVSKTVQSGFESLTARKFEVDEKFKDWRSAYEADKRRGHRKKN